VLIKKSIKEMNKERMIINRKKVSIAFLERGELYDSVKIDCHEYPEFINRTHLLSNVTYGHVFRKIRQVLYELGLDKWNYGTENWNPIGSLVDKNANILLKPNWVLHEAANGLDCLVTHPSIIHSILPFVFLAKPQKVIVGDAPLQYCDIDKLLAKYDFSYVDEVTHGCELEVKDFRRTITHVKNKNWQTEEGCRSIDDFCEVNLGQHSMLEPVSSGYRNFRVTVYDPRHMFKHHYQGCHKYLVAKDILSSDLVINLPKLKTHQKAGVTCCLKNLVGINGNKEYLPHHRKGGSERGGDAYRGASIFLSLLEELWDFTNKFRSNAVVFNFLMRMSLRTRTLLERFGKDGRVEGSWYGNDTIWRTCHDLNKIIIYVTKDGALSELPVRNMLNIVDSVVAGQGDGPLNPDPLNAGMLIGGVNPAAVDWVSAKMISFDPNKIPLFSNAFTEKNYPIASYSTNEIELISQGEHQCLPTFLENTRCQAQPSTGWENYIEEPGG
jgi:uncharacterized protein (DUF362 family)